ncbi:MAG TPA: Hsp70 family protein [Aliidongia sp.]|nr:Hsp70 family protein [Aliidongia sp.]
MSFCGLDFGTSNSTLGAQQGNRLALVPIEGGASTLPSAIFFDFQAAKTLIGRDAIDAYVRGVEGRFMRSLKSVLGTDLIDQDTLLDKHRIGFRDVLARLVGAIKARAETALDRPLDAVVHGRPVHFVDGDEAADARAEAALADIARSAGFRQVSFQYEPIAAARDYEQQVAREEIALIADIGGGTSDFSIVRLGPERRAQADRARDILANDGVRVGGTDFDRLLSLRAVMPHLGYQSSMLRPGLLAPNGYFTDLSTWSKINFLYTPQIRAELRQVRREAARPDLFDRLIAVIEHQYGHRLAMAVEQAKIGLSEESRYRMDLDWIEPDLMAGITQGQFDEATAELAQRIGAMVRRCLDDAGLKPGSIDALFLTGGSTLLGNVRRAILAEVPDARIVEGDKFGSVGIGLTIEAAIRYR